MKIKSNFGPEIYVTSCLQRSQRSLVAQLRSGILPLAIEVGRLKNVPEENRICEMCELDEVEGEFNFLLYCTKHEDLREVLFHEIYGENTEIFWCSDEQKLELFFNFNVFNTDSFISQAWKRRQVHLFNKFLMCWCFCSDPVVLWIWFGSFFSFLVSYKPIRAGHTCRHDTIIKVIHSFIHSIMDAKQHKISKSLLSHLKPHLNLWHKTVFVIWRCK